MVSILLIRFLILALTGISEGNSSLELSIMATSRGIVFCSQGQTPQSISQRMTPNDQISALMSQMSPLSTSGAMQMGDPTIVAAMSFYSSSSLQKPKSASLITPLWNSILVGFKSRCRMFSEQRASKAFLSWRKMTMASDWLSLVLLLMSSARVPPLQNSQTRQQLLAVRSIYTNLMMLGLLILERMAISLLVNSLSLGVCLNFYTFITLTAQMFLFLRFSALQTFPYCPWPTFSCSTQSSITLFIQSNYYHIRPSYYHTCLAIILCSSFCRYLWIQSFLFISERVGLSALILIELNCFLISNGSLLSQLLLN